MLDETPGTVTGELFDNITFDTETYAALYGVLPIFMLFLVAMFLLSTVSRRIMWAVGDRRMSC